MHVEMYHLVKKAQLLRKQSQYDGMTDRPKKVTIGCVHSESEIVLEVNFLLKNTRKNYLFCNDKIFKFRKLLKTRNIREYLK